MMDMSARDSGGGHSRSSLFHEVCSISNLLTAWCEFRKGKRKKKDVAQFDLHLEDNLFRLHTELIEKRYAHDPYDAFFVCDPKRRHIHKASVRDRVLHQAIFRVLYPLFDKHFIYDSYSSRIAKGTHAGVIRLTSAARKVSENWKRTAYALKCDVQKFFDSIDHSILRTLIHQKIDDPDLRWLIDEIFKSFERQSGKGLPLGNVTSQLFANVYLNEFDQFMKHQLKALHYFRYCDDFVVLHTDKNVLEQMLPKIRQFLQDKLLLILHPHKIEIRKLRQGIDFLGYVMLPHTHVVRVKTGCRIIRRLKLVKHKFGTGQISTESFHSSVVSYLGILSHSANRSLRSKILRYII